MVPPRHLSIHFFRLIKISIANDLHNHSEEAKELEKSLVPANKALGWRKKVALVLFGVFISILLMEIILRIHNPFFRLSRGRIKLPVYASYHWDNKVTPLLDRNIVHTKNSLGFRGKEIIEAEGKYKIIAVGGSTTECFYLSDGDTWVDHLEKKMNQFNDRYWINNAGLGGHTSYGHSVQLHDHIFKLKPELILMLVGINDVGTDIDQQKFTNNPGERKGLKAKTKNMALHSEVIDMAINFGRLLQAAQKGLIDRPFKRNLSEHTLTNQEDLSSILNKHQQKYLTGYRDRIEQIADACRARNIELVLITQAAPYGRGSDPYESINLETVVVDVGVGADIVQSPNGYVAWRVLELYNQVLRDIATEQDVPLIDLAEEMPKSYKYYYDHIHFGKDGSRKASEIIHRNLIKILAEKNSTSLSSDQKKD